MFSSQIPSWGSYPFERARNELPQVKTSTIVGISVAIAGNILISLALNLQKMAHRRVEAAKLQRSKDKAANSQHSGPNIVGSPSRNGRGASGRRRADNPSLNERDEDTDLEHSAQRSPETTTLALTEAQPLLEFPENGRTSTYGATEGNNDDHTAKIIPAARAQGSRSLLARALPGDQRRKSSTNDGAALDNSSEGTTVLPVDVVTEDSLRTTEHSKAFKQKIESPIDVNEGNESDYLKSKLWWLGFLLMNVGELGNFISYAFAPASVVAPLGTFALIANCIFSPIILGERFIKRDLLGIVLAVIGAVTVVLSSNSSDVRLDPDGLLRAISQQAFIAYSIIYAVGALILATLSAGRLGRQWVFVDVGLCALFGGFTVLSTKAVSTLLTLQWIEMFTKWITYPTIFVLVATGVGQIRYLNRALMHFDSKVVIPIQFVLFNLSAIVGSAILYGDFKKATFHQLVTFLYGCAATFGGVFIIAWASSDDEDDEELVEDADPEESVAGIHGAEDEEGGNARRRRYATLVLPNGARGSPILHHRHSAVNLIGLSPAQHLLLVHTPPRDVPDMRRETDAERDPGVVHGSFRRRRAISWFGDDALSGATRDSSILGRLRHGSDVGSRVGSAEGAGR